MLLALLLSATLGQAAGTDIPRELIEAERLYGKDARRIQEKHKNLPKNCRSSCVEAQEMCLMMCKNNRLKSCNTMCAPALEECVKAKCGGKKKGK